MNLRRKNDALVERISRLTKSPVDEIIREALELYGNAVAFEQKGYKVMAVFEKATMFRMKALRGHGIIQ